MKKTLFALCCALAALLLLAAGASAATEEFDKYNLESVFAELSDEQAGAHADLTVGFKLTTNGPEPYALTKDLFVKLPPGMIGNPQGFPRCTLAQFGEVPSQSKCPQDAQLGVSEITLGGASKNGVNATLLEPVYNLTSPGGETVARLGLFAGPYPSIIDVRVDPVDYSLEAAIEGAPSAAHLVSAVTTFWGVPAAESHDEQRMTPEEALHQELPAGGRKSGQPKIPFLSNPTDCSLAREVVVEADSYQRPAVRVRKEAPFPQISGCQQLSFAPTFTATATNPEASAPTGLDAVLQVPQDETPNGLATANLKSATVALPQGLSINPAAADGLAACSPEEAGFGRREASHCPEAAKLGSVELEVPALEHTLHGAIYQRTPEPGHLFRFWLVTDEEGVHLKLPAEIEANPLTGQLTTHFDGIPSLGGNPQVPFSELRLHVFGGPRAPLATPASCGTYQTHYEFSPWSGKPPAAGDAPMQITSGCGTPRFLPQLQAGTTNSSAGAFAPFTMTLTRSDGEPNPQALSVHLPKGLLAKLGGVPLCPEDKTASADCPPGSQVGSLAAAAGVGGAPLWIPQPGKAPTAVYLAGPYKGAPYSIVSRVPAQAGPFDLGTVVNRAGIYVDPETAEATIKTDPLPQILEGVPVAYRAIHVDVDRKGFTLNATGCDKKQIEATVTAPGGASATARAAYQATNCAKLSYAPKLRLSLRGKTARTGHPALHAVLTQGPHQSNTASATVILPPSEFIDQDHINNPCTRVQFAEGNCPKLSILGHATAVTPLLDKPLRGPVYFRSNGGARELPDIVADLHGPIHVTLVGFVDAVHKKGSETSRIRTRFANVPDAPVTKFTMDLFGGKKRGLLVNSRDLCQTARRAKVSFTAQNGLERSSNQRFATSCGGKKRG